MTTVYGLKNCDSCRKAMSQLKKAGQDFTFQDIRTFSDLAQHLPDWVEAVGLKALVNTRSTTWRNMTADQKDAALCGDIAILVAHPTLLKRPIINHDGSISIGLPPLLTG